MALFKKEKINLLNKRIKILIAFFGIAIILITFGLKQYLIDEIRNDARVQIEQITKIYSEKVNTSSVEELTVIMEVLLPSITFPLIITTNDEIYAVRNIDILQSDPNYKNKIMNMVSKMDSYFDPIPIDWNPNSKSMIHYGDPILIQKIQWIPYIQLGLLILFISLIFFSLVLIGNHEKDKLWVGMTRETAHQLGTPISSLLGWIDLLKEENVDNKIVKSMNMDVQRLNEIADRFYKIGSKPKLIEIDLLDLSEEICNYLKVRIPKKRKINLSIEGDHSHVLGAKTLLGWAIENLIKNSIDAIESESGNIQINLSDEVDYVNLDVTDNGKGISKGNWRKIFTAGFSQKKKGWGLGLSLTKRIIENIHNGKIFVLESKKEKTTIRIKLPIYNNVN